MSTAYPENIDEFKAYCLGRLGAPVINIDVSDDQVEARIADALRFYADYHYDGQAKVYYKHPLTQDDINQQYIILPDNIIDAIRIFDFDAVSNATNIFDLRYQIALNDLYTLTSQSMIPYYMSMQHLEFLEQLLVGQKPIRFTRHQHKLHIDMDWQTMVVGNYILVEAYSYVDPERYPDVWKDRWLLEYGTMLIQKQWGQNLKKFGQIALPGGVVLNGQQLWNEAEERIREMEDKVTKDYMLPPMTFIG